MSDRRPIEEGDRFEDKDVRQGNRVIRIVAKFYTRFTYEVEVAELNPATVGKRHTIHESTLRKSYTRVSR